MGTGSLRRQSSAFEFRSRSQKAEHGPRVEPVYENLRRDATSRASLRQAEFFLYLYFLRARVCSVRHILKGDWREYTKNPYLEQQIKR